MFKRSALHLPRFFLSVQGSPTIPLLEFSFALSPRASFSLGTVFTKLDSPS